MYRLFLSTRYLKSRFVNLLSVAGVAVGVAVMIVVTAVMDGFQAKVKDVVRGTLSHLVLSPDGNTDIPAFSDLEKELRRHPDVVGVAPQATSYVAHPFTLGTNPQTASTAFHPMEAIGIDWEKEREVSRIASYLVAAGEDPANPFANKRAQYREQKTGVFSRAFLEQFVGTVSDPAEWLGKNVEVLLLARKTDAAGNEDLAKATYQIVVSAVYDAEDQTADMSRFYMERETLREVAHLNPEYMEVRVAVRDYDQAARVKRDLKARIAGFQIKTWEEVRAHYLRAVNNEKVLLLIVLSFVVLLAGFTILATLTLTVVEKFRDIGLLKAVGATTGGVLSLFLGSGLMIGILGGIAGLGLGIFVSHHVNGIKDALASVGIQIFPPDIYLFRDIPTLLDPFTVASIALGGVLVAFLAGLPPALRAARMDPVVALRHE